MPLIEVLFDLREVFPWRSDQPAFPQSGLSLFLRGEVFLDANHRGRLDGRRRRTELPCGGIFQLARKFLKQARRLLLIRRGVTTRKRCQRKPHRIIE